MRRHCPPPGDRMIDTLSWLLLVAATVGAGLIGGLFFAFSTFIMSAFDRLPAAGAIAAMQSINVTILNPVFFTAFFGTAVVAIILVVVVALDAAGPEAVLVVIGAAAYILGSIGVTMMFNVPLNNVLARAPVHGGDPEDDWRQYRKPWTAWNHVRTAASLAAAAAFAAAVGV